MGLTATLKEFYLKTLGGMNNLVEQLDLQDNWVESAKNCRFEESPGVVDKRPPVTYFNSTTMGSGAYGVTGLYRFYSILQNTNWVSIHDTIAYVGTDTAGTWTSIRTGLTAGKRTSFVTYKDLCIASNGYDNPWVYDGATDNVTWELGSCKAIVATASTGSLDTSAEYSYQVVITVSGADYICGAVSNVVNSGTAKANSLSQIPLGPTGTTARKVYRTDGGASPGTHTNFKLLATISDNTTVTYTDTIGDASLGAAVASVADDMPKGAEIRMHRERMFMTRDPNTPNRIYYSNAYFPHIIQQTTLLDYMDINPDDNDEITGIPIQLGVMVCIKRNTIRRVHITSPTSGADPSLWYADDPISWNGCPAPWSIAQTPNGIVYLGWDHWYLFDGTGSQPIIDEFDTKEILPGRYFDTIGHYHNGIMLAAYTDNTNANQYHDKMMQYNFKRKALSIDEWTSTTVKGPNCFASKVGADETGDLYFGDSQLGSVLKDKESENF